ncbi:MAG TPA: TraR/DksA family transcriptional regulator [Acidobacteriota bacterium]|jgi:DnaK suppressor protein
MDKKKLQYYRNKLLEKQKELGEIFEKNKDYSMENLDDGIQDMADMASNSYTKEFLLSLSDSERTMLKNIQEALGRIDKGAYGVCQECEEPINTKRLEAIPWARLCVPCQEKQEKGLL